MESKTSSKITHIRTKKVDSKQDPRDQLSSIHMQAHAAKAMSEPKDPDF